MNVNPIVFTIGPLEVRWYGIAMAGAIVIGVWYLVTRGKSKGLNEDHLLTMSLLVILFGVIGARLMFVAANFPSWFWEDPIRVFKTYQGGLAWHGGLIGGVLAAWLYLKYRAHIDFNVVADLCVPAIAMGYILIRLANITNQEVMGRMTVFNFGRWPAQLIAAGISLAMLIRHFLLTRKSLPDGHLFWSFLFYHQVLRAGVEETVREMPIVVNLYTNTNWGIGLLTMVQVTTLPVLLFIGWILWFRLKRPKKLSS